MKKKENKLARIHTRLYTIPRCMSARDIDFVCASYMIYKFLIKSSTCTKKNKVIDNFKSIETNILLVYESSMICEKFY